VELPRLEPLYQKYRDQGFSVIAIDGRRDRERAVKFIEKNQLTYACLETGEGDADVVAQPFGVSGYPTSFLIDGDGRILYFHLGFSEGDEVKLEKEIQKVLAGR